jgi:hypothetical protein
MRSIKGLPSCSKREVNTIPDEGCASRWLRYGVSAGQNAKVVIDEFWGSILSLNLDDTHEERFLRPLELTIYACII